MQEITLNPITLEPDENGQPYVRLVVGSNIIYIANSPTPPEPKPTDEGGDM